MTPLDILAKNHSDKQKSRLDRLNKNGTPKKPQEAQRLVCCLPGGLQQYNTVVDLGEGPGGPGPSPHICIYCFLDQAPLISESG